MAPKEKTPHPRKGRPLIIGIAGVTILLTYLSLNSPSSPSNAAAIRATPTPTWGTIATPDAKTVEFLSNIDPALLSGCEINKGYREGLINLDTPYGSTVLNPTSVALNSLQANRSEDERIFLQGIVVGRYDNEGNVKDPKLCVKEGNEIKFRKLIATGKGYSWEIPVAQEPEFKLDEGGTLLEPGTIMPLQTPDKGPVDVEIGKDISAITYTCQEAGEAGQVTGQFFYKDGYVWLRVDLQYGIKSYRMVTYDMETGKFGVRVPPQSELVAKPK